MDYNKLGETASQHDTLRPTVNPLLVLQVDADVLSYDCANLDEPYSLNCLNLNAALDNIRVSCGAAHINTHLTLGLKGGRHEMATVKPYQVGRAGKRDPALVARVKMLRNYMANYITPDITPVVNVTQEADDSLAQYQTDRIAQHGENSSAIYSIDKDLWMIAGLHVEPYTFEKYRVEGFGHTEYREVGNVKPKLIGRGTSWFWHQMIMGDTADDIPGLPKLGVDTANHYFPLKKHNPNRKPLACGEAKAVGMLKGVTTDNEAFEIVMEAYHDFYDNGVEMFLEQAYLLWIRPDVDLWHVLTFFESLGYNLKPTRLQDARMDEFLANRDNILLNGDV